MYPTRTQGVCTWEQEIRPAFKEVGVPLVAIPGSKMPVLKIRKPKVLPELVELVEDSLDGYPGLLRGCDGFKHSSAITDESQIQLAVTKMAHNPPGKFDEKASWLCYISRSLDRPRTRSGKLIRAEVDIGFEAQASVPAGNTSSGFVPTLHNTGGSKEKNKNQAIQVNMYDMHLNKGALPTEHHHMSFPKGEVLKSSKVQPRVIQVPSQSDYIMLWLCSLRKDRTATGCGIGLNMRNGGALRLFINWFLVLTTLHYPNLLWTQFLDILRENQAHESDKTNWDTTPELTDGLPYVISWLCGAKPLQNRRPWLRALTSYINPLVALGSDVGAHCPGKVASGTVPTADGNTARHQDMNFATEIALELALGKCNCDTCGWARSGFGPGLNECGDAPPLWKFDLAHVAFHYGDDYLGLSKGTLWDDLRDRFMDRIFHTQTKTENYPFFSKPTWPEGRSAEFLKNQFEVDDNNVIRPYRNMQRPVAKVRHGACLGDPAKLQEQLKCVMYEAGTNELLFNWARDLYTSIDTPDEPYDPDDKILAEFRKRAPLMSEAPIDLVTFNDLWNVTGGFKYFFDDQLKRMSWYTQTRREVE